MWMLVLAVGLSLSVAAQLQVDPEVHMNTSQLVTSKGYPFEEYDAHTRDGYILGLHRIPHGKNGTDSGARPVILLQHGLLSCSACWVENLANESLGFILADAGYDVWMGNNRGNTYSMRHERLNPKQKEFWDFSWDEMGLEDLPSSIDKVLEVTGASQLFYVAYSQGATAAYAGLSTIPGLQDKLKLLVSLAPAVYMTDTQSPMRLLAPYAKDIAFIERLGSGKLMANSKLLTWFSSVACGKIPSSLCENFLFVVCGYDEMEMNKTRLPVYTGQNPAGTSVNNVVHFAQMINTKQYQMFDYGSKHNMQRYNQTTPPTYYPDKITVPSAVFSGSADWLVDPVGLQRLINESQNVVYTKVIPGWEHLDFIWAMNAPKMCYEPMLKLLEDYV